MRFWLFAIMVSFALASCKGPTQDVVETEPNRPTTVGTQAAPQTTGGAVRHIGNAGLLIQQGQTKILFDPLYRNGFNNYYLVPADVKADVLSGSPPFDDINAILISHAHGDHFDAEDVIEFHRANPQALIIGPAQAMTVIEEAGDVSAAMRARMVPMGLEYGQDPLKLEFEGLMVEAVRIPHAGGPGRRAIENLVYRVTLEGAATVMHMGDADPALEYFSPFESHWQARTTDTAFPPYWFFLGADGVEIVDNMLNAEDAVGVHVPIIVPNPLLATGREFFGRPGKQRPLKGSPVSDGN